MEMHKIRSICVRVMSGLPEEMMTEILSRLPVKSLLRFRCVSKAWRSLIGSKYFIKKQLEADSRRNTSLDQQWGLLCIDGEFSKCSLLSLFNKPEILALGGFNFATTSTTNNIVSIIDSISLVGSCNGLVCILLNKEEFVLWNPCTRISKKLPNIIDKHHHPHRRLQAYGFGCDEYWSGDYKVVVILEKEDYSLVYSLKKSDSWKKIRNPCFNKMSSFFYYYDKRGILKSGSRLYWEIKDQDKRFGLELDLKTEVFEMVKEEAPIWLSTSRTLRVYVLDDESSDRVRTTFPSLDECRFMYIRNLLIGNIYNDHTSSSNVCLARDLVKIHDHTSSTNVSPSRYELLEYIGRRYEFIIYSESLETLA
ncbi:hypothetical protein OROMI_026518 [Orobanche minor]